MELDQLESFCGYPIGEGWWNKMVAMRRREVVVVWTYFKCRANRISWRIACGLVLKGRSSRRQGGAEERRAEMMKVMTILCHSKASTKK